MKENTIDPILGRLEVIRSSVRLICGSRRERLAMSVNIVRSFNLAENERKDSKKPNWRDSHFGGFVRIRWMWKLCAWYLFIKEEIADYVRKFVYKRR